MGRLQKLLRTKQIKVDGKKAESNLKLVMGQEIRVPPLDNEKAQNNPDFVSKSDAEFIKSKVLFKDNNIIVINKPSGLAVQGGTNTERHIDGMLEALKFELEEKPKLVHRIDKDTSGILVLARNRKYAETSSSAHRKHLQNFISGKSGKLNYRPYFRASEQGSVLYGKCLFDVAKYSSLCGKKLQSSPEHTSRSSQLTFL